MDKIISMGHQFENLIVNPIMDNQVPEDKLLWKRVHPSYIIVLLMRAVLAVGFFFGLVYFFTEIFEYREEMPGWSWYVILAALIIYFLLNAFISFRRRMYIVRTHDVMSRRGFLAIKTSVMPYVRVQQVRIEEGVLSRLFSLATIQVVSAGGDALSIHGIKKEEAEAMRKHIVQKIKNENGSSF